jgi:hypothetical protein
LKLSDLFADNGHAKRNGSPAQSKAAFNWLKCVSDFSEADAQNLAAWRGLSAEFVGWLHTQGIVGIFGGATAFANQFGLQAASGNSSRQASEPRR